MLTSCGNEEQPAATTAPPATLHTVRSDGVLETLEDVATWIAYVAEATSEQQDRAAERGDIEQAASSVLIDNITVSAWSESNSRVVVFYDNGGAGSMTCVELIAGRAVATRCDSVALATSGP